MPDPIYIPNHDEQAQLRKAEQYRFKINFSAMLETHNVQFQAIEDMLWDLYALRSVDTAVGTQLDVLGKIVGEHRGGTLDDNYRLRIRARIRANLSNGTVEDIYAVFEALIGVMALPGVVFSWTDFYPAGFVFVISGYILLPTFVPVFVGFLRDSRGAGIEAQFGWQETDDPNAFCFEGGTGLGLGDYNDPTVGGALVGIL